MHRAVKFIGALIVIRTLDMMLNGECTVFLNALIMKLPGECMCTVNALETKLPGECITDYVIE